MKTLRKTETFQRCFLKCAETGAFIMGAGLSEDCPIFFRKRRTDICGASSSTKCLSINKVRWFGVVIKVMESLLFSHYSNFQSHADETGFSDQIINKKD